MATTKALIVVVDDDAAVRNSLKFSLEVDGFAVRTYADAEEFLGADDVAASQCLIIDQDMPRGTGLELVAALRERGVKVPTILISGHVTPSLTGRAADVGIPVIEKPFFGHGLVEAIRSAIGCTPI